MGPVGAARVGYVDGEYVLNPEVEDMDQLRTNPEQRLDLVVAGTKDAVFAPSSLLNVFPTLSPEQKKENRNATLSLKISIAVYS